MAPSTVVFITGGNTGLGFETVKQLVQSSQPYTILLGGRDLNKAKAASEEAQKLVSNSASAVEPVQIDVEDDESIEAAVKHVSNKYGHVDVLINNAGASFDQSLGKTDITIRQVWDKAWSVNTTGAFIVTHQFAPLLLKSLDPRLLFIASGTSSIQLQLEKKLPIDHAPTAAGWPKKSLMIPAYRSSKAGLNMMMREWVRIFAEDGVKVWAISPGFLATGLGGDKEVLKKMGAEEPSEGGRLVVDVVEGKRDGDVGKVVLREGVQPW